MDAKTLITISAILTLTTPTAPAFADAETSQKLMQGGCAALRQGQGQQAIVQLTQAIQADPSNLTARRYLAQAEIACGQAKAALDVMKATVQADPSADNLCGLGDAYFALGNASESRKLYEAALQTSPDHTDSIVGLANVYIQSGWYQNAKKLCSSALTRAKSPKDSARLGQKLAEIERCLQTVTPSSS